MPPAPQTDKRGIDFGANFDGTSKKTVNKQATSQAEDSGKKNADESADIVTPVTISIAKAINNALENQKAPPPNPHDLDSTLRTYDQLWETLNGLEMVLGHAEGYCAWLKGDILNWIKPLPGMKREKLIPHGEWRPFCKRYHVSPSTAYHDRRINKEWKPGLARTKSVNELRAKYCPSYRAALQEVDEVTEDGKPTRPHEGKSKGGKSNPKALEVTDLAPRFNALVGKVEYFLDKELPIVKVGKTDEDKAVARAEYKKIVQAIAEFRALLDKLEADTIKNHEALEAVA